jgi:anthranilate synthase component 1
MVRRAQEHIRAGDIFQAVLSQRFDFTTPKDPLAIYKALRVTNPSPYMYFLKLDGLAVSGSSPETLVKLNKGIVTSRPIAGTRPRGRTRAEDRRLEKELLADEKERAEHVMLVDLARNDLGRICRSGSVRVTEFMRPDRYSRVMHLTSNVAGRLGKGLGAFDVLPATFPAGTVSGAPKIRAMEIIDDLEKERRGIYAGAIGYFGFGGDMDFCITIRTIVQKDRTCHIQAGAGIVCDSTPDREYAETMHKASALKRAVEIAP